MKTCFSIKNLNLYYGEKQALKNINMEIVFIIFMYKTKMEKKQEDS